MSWGADINPDSVAKLGHLKTPSRDAWACRLLRNNRAGHIVAGIRSRRNGHGLTGSSSTIGHMSQIEGSTLMSTHHRPQATIAREPVSPVTRLASNPPRHHTHVQQVARGLGADHSGGSGC